MLVQAVEASGTTHCVHKNRERILFLILFATVVLCFVWVRFIFHKRTDEPGGTVLTGENFDLQVGRLNWEPLPSLPPQRPWPSQLVAGNTPVTSPAQSIAVQSTPTAAQNLLYLRRFPLTGAQSEAIGVVDVGRLLAVHPPASDSQEARANAISDIQRATAWRAAAHDCVVVLDSSGNSQSGWPVVLSAVETFDLTEEVMQQLAQ